jgi:homopolymeric O-antigen transport system permease protein
MLEHLRRLISYRGLLWNLALAELKARHRQTALGMLWAIAQPLSMMVVTTVVFSMFVRISEDAVPYAIVAYVGLWSWLLFANSLTASVASIVANMNLVTKANFPREVIPLSKIVVTGFDFLIGLLFLAVLMAVYRVPLTLSVLVVPGLLLIQAAMIVGMMLIFSAMYVLHRDLGALLPLGLQVLMLISPVLYPLSLVPDQFKTVYLLNPMAALIEAYRTALLYGQFPTVGSLGGAFLAAVLLFGMGYRYFKSVEQRFADVM